MAPEGPFAIHRKTIVIGVLILAVFAAATWAIPTVVSIAAPLIMFLTPADEEYGDCTITKSKGAYSETERFVSHEQACERICADTQASDDDDDDDVGDGDGDYDDHDVLCQFESESSSWERSP